MFRPCNVKNMSCAVCLVALMCSSPPLYAQAPDALWQSVVQQVRQTKQWAAKDITTVIDKNKNGKVTHKSITSQFVRWQKNTPIYGTIEPTQTSGPHSNMGDAMEAINSKFIEAIMEPDAEFKRLGDQPLRGKTSAVYSMSESGGVGWVEMKIWVDPIAGSLYQTVVRSHMALAFDVSVTTEYEPESMGLALPTSVNVSFDRLIPFKKAKFTMKEQMSNWIKRPTA